MQTQINLMKIIPLFLVGFSLLVGCNDAQSHLEAIEERGELRVVTRYNPTTYYVQGDDIAGFEYALAKRFAAELNVGLKMIVPDNLTDLLEQIRTGDADIAAAGLTITDERKLTLNFGPVYQTVTQQLVYRQGGEKPKNIGEISPGQLEVVANSSHVENLEVLQAEYPELVWTANSDLDSAGLLELVDQQLIDYTIADSTDVAANQALFPDLRVAFSLTEPEPIAWALPKTEDEDFSKIITDFFTKLKTSGDLDKLLEEHFGHIRSFDHIDTSAFHKRMQTHLPKYQALFEQAGEKHGVDWKLLAAVGYQESHWNKDARSPTGVRGLMMLTTATANRMKIANRKDPAQSIDGGAGYLALLKAGLPDNIEDPDRTWLALAAYNVGLGHLIDARKLARRAGKDPAVWTDIKAMLPRLSQRKWYEQTRHGYARGNEPVRYVENIRRYYDILQRQDLAPIDTNPVAGKPAPAPL